MTRSWKALLLCAPLFLIGCSDDDDPPANNGGNNPPPAGTGLIGVEDNKLFQFSPAAPGTIQGEVTLTGYVGEGTSNPPFVIDIDFRPDAAGALYALMSDNRFYSVNTSTGAMTLAGTFAVDSGVVLRTFSWDTVRGRVRAIGDRENYDLNPDGTLFSHDSDLAYASTDAHAADEPTIQSLSFTGGNGSTQNTAYGIDSTLDTLVTIGSVNGNPLLPDSGQVFTVGALSQPVGGAGSPPFDVDRTNAAIGYVTDSDGIQTHVFRVDLATGAMTDLGEVGNDRRIQALAVSPGGAGGGGQTGGGTPPPGAGEPEICSTQIAGTGTAIDVLPNDVQCLGCRVVNPQFAIDGDPETFATFDLQLGLLLGGVGVRVHAAPGVVYPAGRIAGGVFNFPGADLLAVAVAPDLTISTFLGGEAQDSTTLGGDTLVLDIAHSVADDEKFFAGFVTTKPFDSVEIKPGIGLVGAFTRLNLFSTCAGSIDEGSFP